MSAVLRAVTWCLFLLVPVTVVTAKPADGGASVKSPFTLPAPALSELVAAPSSEQILEKALERMEQAPKDVAALEAYVRYLDLALRSPEGLAEIEASRKAGDSTASAVLGVLHSDGLITGADRAHGIALLEESAAAGNPLGRFLGILVGLSHQNRETAEANLQRMAEQEGPFFKLAVGITLLRPRASAEALKRGFDYISSAAKALPESPYVATLLGELHAKGIGTARNYPLALSFFKRGADGDYAYAQLMMGIMLLDGLGTPKQPKAALGYLERAAAQGSGDAMSILGLCFRDGLGVERDFAKAREWFMRGSEAGSLSAERGLAEMLYDGQGVKQDMARARAVFLDLAARGDPASMNLASWMLEEGEGGEPDHTAAFRLAMQAAEAGAPGAVNRIGVMYRRAIGVERDDRVAAEWYARAADSGDAEAMGNLGYLYSLGEGVEKDDAKAFELFERGAERGDPQSMNNLASSYAEGLGVATDDDKAVTWYRKSADAGFPNAQFALANFYLLGRALPRDPTKALVLLQKAWDQGYAPAGNQLGLLHEQGELLPRDPDKAMTLYLESGRLGDPWGYHNAALSVLQPPLDSAKTKRAIELYELAFAGGLAASANNIGNMYLEGLGVPVDTARAFEWLMRAHEAGEPQATVALAGMYRDGVHVEQDPPRAARLLEQGASAGNMNGKIQLAHALLHGMGMPANPARHRALLDEIAQSSDPAVHVAMASNTRSGIVDDPANELRWWKRAAELEDPAACDVMGYTHLVGLGVEQDEVKARIWFEKAAKLGHPMSIGRLGLMYLQGQGGLERDQTRGVALLQQAGEAGDPDAWFNLGYAHDIGELGAEARGRSVEYYQRAVALGHAQAALNLAAVHINGEYVPQDLAAAYRWALIAERLGLAGEEGEFPRMMAFLESQLDGAVLAGLRESIEREFESQPAPAARR